MEKTSFQPLAKEVGRALKNKKLVLATAESCTGGMVSTIITSISGSASWFDRGFVTYSNNAKEELLEVKKETLQIHGAISKQTAQEMAEGALKNSNADISVAITGIAGPTGDTPTKPIGTVYFGWANKKGLAQTKLHYFKGNRSSIREQAAEYALKELLEFIKL